MQIARISILVAKYDMEDLAVLAVQLTRTIIVGVFEAIVQTVLKGVLGKPAARRRRRSRSTGHHGRRR
jgi:hypothetical protein